MEKNKEHFRSNLLQKDGTRFHGFMNLYQKNIGFMKLYQKHYAAYRHKAKVTKLDTIHNKEHW